MVSGEKGRETVSASQQTLLHTMTPLEHLQSCAGADYRPEWMRKPFTLSREGAAWSCASDGHCLLMLKTPVPGVEPLSPADGASVTALLEELGKRERRTTVADWLSVDGFLAPSPPVAAPVCDICKGNKPPIVECSRCDSEGEIECWECGHEKTCPDCKGTGRTGGCGACNKPGDLREKPDVGQFFGVYIDRRIMRRVLGPLRPEQLLVGVGQELDPLLLEDATGSWFAVVMPMRQPDTTAETPVLEAKS